MYPGTHAATAPDRPAVVMSDTGAALTYAELDARSARLARALHDRGLRRGDDVALIAENRLEVYEVFWAAVRSGLYVTAINFHLTPPEAAYIIDDCDAAALIVSAAHADVAGAVVGDTPKVRHRIALGGPIDGHDDYEDVMASADPTPLAHQPRGTDMLYSSGTTGRPKGIKKALPEGTVDEVGDPLTGIFGGAYGFGVDTVYLCPAPLYHAAPLRFGGMVHELGGTVVVMPRFDAAAALEAIDTYAVTHSQWVPTMFVRMLKLPESVRESFDGSTHRVAVHAAAPCPVDVKRAMIGWWGPILQEYYAATEAIGITMIDSATWLEQPGSVGRSALGTIHVCGDDGVEVAAGEVGTIWFERDARPFTYHKDPDRTEDAYHPDHPTWATTGDIGYVDEDGFLHLTDRKAFMIISGGVNIYPQEVEDALTLHPDVHDLAVVGMPDEEMGEQVVAVVQPAEGVAAGPDLAARLEAHLREQIAGYKVPRRWVFTDDLPRTATGKLQKHVVKQRLSG